MKKIAVGSKNPVKIEAVRIAFEKVWPEEEWTIVGIDVGSGVSDQPMSDSESIRGARNRATRAIKAVEADYGIGLEGGIQKIDDLYFDCGWIVVVNQKDEEGIGSSPRVIVPQKMLDLILQGNELGIACDILFGTINSKQANGHYGLMTNNNLTRTDGYVSATIMALSRYLHPEIF